MMTRPAPDEDSARSMNLARMGLFARLTGARSVLIAGCGGGFDVFCGLPLYFALAAEGKRVHLANLSFTRLRAATGRWLTPVCLRVDADSTGPDYFPERLLSEWLALNHEPAPVYCFEKTGVIPLREAYEVLVQELDCDAIVLVDGGTDSLMRGDEWDLGTPHEDLLSIIAAAGLDVDTKLLCCLGFGIDSYHGVCHAQFLEAVAGLANDGAYLGTFSLHQEMPEARMYMDAVRHACRGIPDRPSIVNTCIVSALEGRYGDFHTTSRTAGSRLWINPLMSLYWTFELVPVAERVLYRDRIESTANFPEVVVAIEEFRAGLEKIRPHESIPV